MVLTFLNGTEYISVFQQQLKLNKETNVTLILQQEKSDNLLVNPAKIIISYNKNATRKKYIFEDNCTKFPILYVHDTFQNKHHSSIISLVNTVNILDMDDDGTNEIFIYGSSHYGGSGLMGKVAIFKYDKAKTIHLLGVISATDNFEIQYLKQEHIIILAQYIWRSGIEGHYGDKHKYQFYIYEYKDKLKKIPIYLSNKKINDRNNHIIQDNLSTILKKYKAYKKEMLPPKEASKYIQLVKTYWQKVSQKDFKYLKSIYADNIYYYGHYLKKDMVINDKKNRLKKIDNIKFSLNNFLVYQKDNHIFIEYDKMYDINDSMDYGHVKSIMGFKKEAAKNIVYKESDTAILNIKKDLD